MNDENIDIHEVKNKHSDEIADLPGVQSVGVDAGKIGVGLNFDPENAEADPDYPDEIDGVKVEYFWFGNIGAEVDFQPSIDEDTGIADRTTRVSPIPGGVSIGHKDVTAGTSGFVLTDGVDEYIASNNHVLAAVNSGNEGDPVFQPGPLHDGDHVGGLKGDYPKVQDGSVVDLAWAKIRQNDIKADIVGVGGPYGSVYDPQPGDTLVSSGITSGVSNAKVRQIDATVNVSFGENKTIRLEQQIITDSMSGPGDSGSPVLYKGRPAGMLFAGSERVSVINSAENIEQASGMNIKTADQPPATLESAVWTFPARPYHGNRWEMGVADGDTYWITFDQGMYDTTTEKVRAKHIDTAEIWGNSGDDELEMARKQREFVREWMREAERIEPEWPLIVRTEQAKGDRGRYLAEIYNRNEESLQMAIIEEFGRDYLYEGTSLEDVKESINNLTQSQ